MWNTICNKHFTNSKCIQMNKKYNEIKTNYDRKLMQMMEFCNGRKGMHWILNEESKILRLFRNDEGLILDTRAWPLLRLTSLSLFSTIKYLNVSVKTFYRPWSAFLICLDEKRSLWNMMLCCIHTLILRCLNIYNMGH